MQYFIYIWPSVSIILATLSCLALAEIFVSNDERERLASFLGSNQRILQINRACEPLINSSNRIFGRSMFSLRNMAISFLFSSFWLTFWSLYFYFQSTSQWDEKIARFASLPWMIQHSVILSLLTNFIVDFFSVQQTMYILRRIRKSPAFFNFIILCAVDVFLTTLIFLIFFPVIWGIMNFLYTATIAMFFHSSFSDFFHNLGLDLVEFPRLIIGSISATAHNFYELVFTMKLEVYLIQDYHTSFVHPGTSTKISAEVPFTTWFYTTYMTSFLLWWFVIILFIYIFLTFLVFLFSSYRIQVGLKNNPITTIGIMIGSFVIIIQSLLYFM